MVKPTAAVAAAPPSLATAVQRVHVCMRFRPKTQEEVESEKEALNPATTTTTVNSTLASSSTNLSGLQQRQMQRTLRSGGSMSLRSSTSSNATMGSGAGFLASHTHSKKKTAASSTVVTFGTPPGLNDADTTLVVQGGSSLASSSTSSGLHTNRKKKEQQPGAGSGAGDRSYKFDRVLPPQTSQATVFAQVGKPAVTNVLGGYNGTVLAYGQTGSGKTHSMLGPAGGTDVAALLQGGQLYGERGLLPRMVEELFGQLVDREAAGEVTSWSVSMVVYELYKNEINDLLNPRGLAPPALTTTSRDTASQQQRKHQQQQSSTSTRSTIAQGQQQQQVEKLKYNIRHDGPGGRGVYVENLTIASVGTVQQVMELISTAFSHRKVNSTNSNNTSSRSHSVTELVVEQQVREQMTAGDNTHVGGLSPVVVRKKQQHSPTGGARADNQQQQQQQQATKATFIQSKLSIIDLAGSEQQKKTGAEGDRFEEAKKINTSLSALGNVITALTPSGGNGGKRAKHVPYRGNKLTELLEDALGGNACTTLLCHASNSPFNREETLSTLNFAARAKEVENKPVVNRQRTREELEELLEAAQKKLRAQDEEIKKLRSHSAMLALENSHHSKSPLSRTNQAALHDRHGEVCVTPGSRQSLRHGALSARKSAVMFTRVSMALDDEDNDDDDEADGPVESSLEIQLQQCRMELQCAKEGEKAALLKLSQATARGEGSQTPSPPRALGGGHTPLLRDTTNCSGLNSGRKKNSSSNSEEGGGSRASRRSGRVPPGHSDEADRRKRNRDLAEDEAAEDEGDSIFYFDDSAFREEREQSEKQYEDTLAAGRQHNLALLRLQRDHQHASEDQQADFYDKFDWGKNNQKRPEDHEGRMSVGVKGPFLFSDDDE